MQMNVLCYLRHVIPKQWFKQWTSISGTDFFVGEGGCRKIEHDDDDDDVDDDDDAISLNTWLPFKNLSAFFFFYKTSNFSVHFYHVYVMYSFSVNEL